MPYFEGIGKYGFESNSNKYEYGDDLSTWIVHETDRVLHSPEVENRRMEMGKAMMKFGVAIGVAPIPGNIDEIVAGALVLAGGATVISETFRN
jgi:hypothetical protein